MQHVRQTGRKLKTRINDHRNHIRRNTNIESVITDHRMSLNQLLRNPQTPGFHFLYFEKKKFRIGRVWKDISYLSRRSTRYGVSRESNTLVSSPRCGSAHHMVAVNHTVWNSAFVGPLNFKSRN